jgi:hypothetical protein
MSRTSFRMSVLAAGAAAAVAAGGAILPAAANAAAHQPGAHLLDTSRPSLAGSWNVQGGVFRFARNSHGQFVDTVVKQRPGVFCPAINDKSDQIVLTQQKKNPLEYKGTWKWFFSSCSFAGNGPTTITLSANGRTAKLVSDPPSGIGGSVEIFTIKRIG